MEEGQRQAEAGLRVDGRPASVRVTAEGLEIEWAARRRRGPWPSAAPSSGETGEGKWEPHKPRFV